MNEQTSAQVTFCVTTGKWRAGGQILFLYLFCVVSLSWRTRSPRLDQTPAQVNLPDAGCAWKWSELIFLKKTPPQLPWIGEVQNSFGRKNLTEMFCRVDSTPGFNPKHRTKTADAPKAASSEARYIVTDVAGRTKKTLFICYKFTVKRI